jgi:hypothetical protein
MRQKRTASPHGRTHERERATGYKDGGQWVPVDRGFSIRHSNSVVAWHPGRLWSPWDMLGTYYPIYQIALALQALRGKADLMRDTNYGTEVREHDAKAYQALIKSIQDHCLLYGFGYTADLAKRLASRPAPQNCGDLYSALCHLDDSLSHQLESEGIYRVPAERKGYFEQVSLFGPRWLRRFRLAIGTFERPGVATHWGRKMRAFTTSCSFLNVG